MPSRREQIQMNEGELSAFLDEQRTMVVATIGPNVRPHLMPLWYVPDGSDLLAWTYSKSQKAVNLERDPHATVQVEDGTEYHELRGVMLECDVETEDAIRVAEALVDRYAGGAAEAREAFRAQAPKRVGLRFRPTRTVTWDHRKLGGRY
jgi:PPOX class probable F420-dependent enzyme